MARTKKIVEEFIEISSDPIILKVMDRETKKIIKIDATKEPDFKSKYLHRSGKEFE